jgi:monothiol glutaredoxin
MTHGSPPCLHTTSRKSDERQRLSSRGATRTLFDVRPEDERSIARIAAARSLDEASQKYLLGLDRDTPIALYCHHGIRSQEAAQQLLREGFRNVYNLKGGIDAWSQSIDPSVPRY